MTVREFGIFADAIKTYFPRDNVLPTEKAMQLWYSELKDIPYQLAHTALRKYVSTNKFAPTIADIREQATELYNQREGDISEITAWQLVWKAICNSGYHAEEEFEKLPETVKRAVGSASQLRQWGLSEVNDNTISYWKSEFQRIYRLEQQKELERRKLSPDVLKLMRPLNNPQIEDKPKELSVEEQRMISEAHSSPAPEGFSEIVRRRLYEQQTKEKSKTV